MTTRSPMGALALETGGLIVDGGWLRILGGGGPRMRGDLASWNGLGADPLLPPHDRFMAVAHDVLGGFFALDGGSLGDGRGGVFYFAPDALSWEDLGLGYSAFVEAMLGDALTSFYADSRWPGWEAEIAAVAPDQGLSFAPPLWTKESKPIERTNRRAVPMLELWGLQQDVARQLSET